MRREGEAASKSGTQPSQLELKLEAAARALFNMAVNDLHLDPEAVPGLDRCVACCHVCM